LGKYENPQISQIGADLLRVNRKSRRKERNVRKDFAAMLCVLCELAVIQFFYVVK